MSGFFRNVVYPAWHWVRRDGVNKANRELNANQWLSAEALRNLQYRKLERLIAFSIAHVPYYRETLNKLPMSDSGSVESLLRHVPPLTKYIIRSRKDDLVSDNLDNNALTHNSTSGSTGESTYFFTDRRSRAYRTAAELRGDSWTGWRLGDKSAKLWGADIDESFATNFRGRLHGLIYGSCFLSSYELSKSKMDRYVDILTKFRPRLLIAYPSALEVFARHCAKNSVSFPSVIAIVCSAEMLWPHQRALIEATFGVKIFNRYGSREFGHVASQCEYGQGLHASIDRVAIEIVRDDGTSCEPGEVGKMLITDLDNYGMPMIRYDIGDKAAWAGHPCECGRGLPLLSKVEGRTLEVVRTPDGQSVGGTFWTILMKKRPGIQKFQIRQVRENKIVLLYVAVDDVPASTLEYVRRKVAETCGQELEVEFRAVDDIPRTRSGKSRIIVPLECDRS